MQSYAFVLNPQNILYKKTFNPSISNNVISRNSRMTPESGTIILCVPLRLKPPMQVASLYSMMSPVESFQTLRWCGCLSSRSRIASFLCIDFGFISRRYYQRNYQTCGTTLSVHEAYFGSPHARKSLPVVVCTGR